MDIRFTVLGEVWRLRFVTRKEMAEQARQYGITARCDGLCVHATKTILIYNRLKGRDRMDTIAHEYNHVIQKHHTEEWVLQVSTDFASLMFDKLGYRCPQDA